MVGPYDVVFHHKEKECKKYQSFKWVDSLFRYKYMQNIRVYRSFLFGKVEETCTQNRNWKRKGQEYQATHLKEGSTLYLVYVDEEAMTTHHEFLTVKKVYHAGLIELEK